MFSTLDGQLAAGVEMDDLRHAVERAAVLAQDVLVLLGPWQLHVHEALATPGDRGRQKKLKTKFWSLQDKTRLFLSCSDIKNLWKKLFVLSPLPIFREQRGLSLLQALSFHPKRNLMTVHSADVKTFHSKPQMSIWCCCQSSQFVDVLNTVVGRHQYGSKLRIDRLASRLILPFLESHHKHALKNAHKRQQVCQKHQSMGVPTDILFFQLPLIYSSSSCSPQYVTALWKLDYLW